MIYLRMFFGVLALVSAVGWWLGYPRFDVYFGVVSFIFGVLCIEGIFKRKSLTPHDDALFAQFRGMFADKGIITAYRGHDFLSSFPREHWLPLSRFVDTWDDAAHSFANRRLEAKYKEFRRAAEALAAKIATYTVPSDYGPFITVLPRGADPENLPQNVKDEAREINSLIPAFVDAHDALLKLGNQLGAKPAKYLSTTVQ